MTQKEILRKIISRLSDELRIYGFEPSYKEQGFIKKTSTAIFLYQFLIYNRTVIKSGANGYLIEPYIWIHLRELEIYYKQITLNTEIKNDTDFKTIGNSLAELLANPNGLYVNMNKSLDLFIFEEKNINYVAEQLTKLFKKVALPYCLNNASIESIDNAINTNPNENKVHTQNENYRIVKGIIAAKLNNNPLLTELIKLYDTQLIQKKMSETTKEEMIRLKRILPKIGTNINN